jgi:hypothetical protein
MCDLRHGHHAAYAVYGRALATASRNRGAQILFKLLVSSPPSTLRSNPIRYACARSQILCLKTKTCTGPIATPALPVGSSSEATIVLGVHSRRCHQTTADNRGCTIRLETGMTGLHFIIDCVCQPLDQFLIAWRSIARPGRQAASSELPARWL